MILLDFDEEEILTGGQVPLSLLAAALDEG
jgi:hypothetical protein